VIKMIRFLKYTNTKGHQKTNIYIYKIGMLNGQHFELGALSSYLDKLIQSCGHQSKLTDKLQSSGHTFNTNPFKGDFRNFSIEAVIVQDTRLGVKLKEEVSIAILIALITGGASPLLRAICLIIRKHFEHTKKRLDLDIDLTSVLNISFENKDSNCIKDVKVRRDDSLMQCVCNLIQLIKNNNFRVTNEFEQLIDCTTKTSIYKEPRQKSKSWYRKLAPLSPCNPERMTSVELEELSKIFYLLEEQRPILAFVIQWLFWTEIPTDELLAMRWKKDIFPDHFYLTVSPSDQVSRPINSSKFINSNNRCKIYFPSKLKRLIEIIGMTRINDGESIAQITGLTELFIRNFKKTIAAKLRKTHPRIRSTTIFGQAKKQNFLRNNDLSLVFIMHAGADRWLENVEFHYCSYSHQYINDKYQELFEKMFLTKGYVQGEYDEADFIGANGIIKTSELKALIDKKRKALNSLFRKFWMKHNSAGVYNELVLFVAFQFFIITNSRTTNTLLETSYFFIRGTNIMLIFDKNSPIHNRHRTIVLPDFLIANILLLEDICDYIINSDPNDKNRTLFNIYENDELRTMTINDLTIYLGDDSKMLSRLRATQRTSFISSEINTNSVRKQMGHNVTNSDHLGKYSFISHCSWDIELQKVLNKKSEGLGLCEIKKLYTVQFSKLKNNLQRINVRAKKPFRANVRNKEISQCIDSLIRIDGIIPYELTEDFCNKVLSKVIAQFDDELACEHLLNRKLQKLKEFDHKIRFSISSIPLVELPPLTMFFAKYLEDALMLQGNLIEIDKNRISKSNLNAYSSLISKCFLFGHKESMQKQFTLENKPTDIELLEFAKTIGFKKTISSRDVEHMKSSLSLYFLPGLLYQYQKAENIVKELDPLRDAIENRGRPKFIPESLKSLQIENFGLNGSTVNDCRNYFAKLDKAINPSKYKRKRREFINNFIRPSRNKDVTYLMKSYIWWVCDLIINGGKRKIFLKWSTLQNYAGIAKHIDRLCKDIELTKISQATLQYLLEKYCNTNFGKELGDKEALLKSWINFLFKNVSNTKSPAKITKPNGYRNALFQHEFDYLLEHLMECYKVSNNSKIKIEILLLIFGFEFSLRRSEAGGLQYNDFQFSSNQNSIYIRYYETSSRPEKSSNARRVIIHDNVPEKISSIVRDFINITESSSENRVFISNFFTEKDLDACFLSLTLKLRQITGDNYFDFHDLRSTGGTRIIDDSLLCTQKIFGTFHAPDIRFLGHGKPIVTLDKYVRYPERLYQQFYFSRRNGWTDQQISNITGRKKAAIRKQRERKLLGKSPISISSITLSRLTFNLENLSHKKLPKVNSTNVDKNISFKDFAGYMLKNRQNVIQSRENIFGVHMLELAFVEAHLSFFKTRYQPDDKDIFRISTLLNSSKKLDNKEATSTKTLSILRKLMSQLKNGIINIDVSDSFVLSTLFEKLSIRDAISIKYYSKNCLISFIHGNHSLIFPRTTKLFFELYYLFITSEDKNYDCF